MKNWKINANEGHSISNGETLSANINRFLRVLQSVLFTMHIIWRGGF